MQGEKWQAGMPPFYLKKNKGAIPADWGGERGLAGVQRMVENEVHGV